MDSTRKDWEVRHENDWSIMTIAGRIDSFNFEHFCGQLQKLADSGKKKIALDLSHVRFLSLPSIKFLTKLATNLEAGGGNFALLAASEKLKRQIDIYATLKTMQVLRTVAELIEWDNGPKPKKVPVPSKAHLEI